MQTLKSGSVSGKFEKKQEEEWLEQKKWEKEKKKIQSVDQRDTRNGIGKGKDRDYSKRGGFSWTL